MRIDKINITEFGALKDRSFSLKDGINVFEGRNESGKSTIAAFIRFMLYGMPKKTASSELSDRERGLSWDNLTAAGNMELSLPDGSYRIERRYQLKEGDLLYENGHYYLVHYEDENNMSKTEAQLNDIFYDMNLSGTYEVDFSQVEVFPFSARRR